MPGRPAPPRRRHGEVVGPPPAGGQTLRSTWAVWSRKSAAGPMYSSARPPLPDEALDVLRAGGQRSAVWLPRIPPRVPPSRDVAAGACSYRGVIGGSVAPRLLVARALQVRPRRGPRLSTPRKGPGQEGGTDRERAASRINPTVMGVSTRRSQGFGVPVDGGGCASPQDGCARRSTRPRPRRRTSSRERSHDGHSAGRTGRGQGGIGGRQGPRRGRHRSLGVHRLAAIVAALSFLF
jgi:hypothetical protein